MTNLIYTIISAVLALVVLFPVKYQSFFTDIATSGETWFNTISSWMAAILNLKADHGGLIIAIGIMLLILFSVGITFIMLLLSARRFDAGVQVDIVQGKSKMGFGSPFSKKGL